MQKARLSAPHC